MTIVHLAGIAEVGGAERVLLHCVRAAREHLPDWRVRVVVPGEGGLAQAARLRGAEVTVVPPSPSIAALGEQSGSVSRLVGWRSAKSYVQALRRIMPSGTSWLLHSTPLRMHLLSRFVGTPAATIWHLHDLLSTRRVSRWLLPALSGDIHAVAVSRIVEHDAAEVLGDVPIVRISNCVDESRFRPGPGNPAALEQDWPEPELSVVRIGLVASYARWKGHELFIEAAAKVRRVLGPSVRFYIVGGPIYQTAGSQWSQQELRDLAEFHKVPVNFVPFRQDIEEVYRALDVVVHCSTRPEPFGLTIAEAMSCGRAVVASWDAGAVREVPPGSVATFPPGNADALAGQILRISQDSAIRKSLGSQAHQAARIAFSSAEFDQKLVGLYRDLAASRAGVGD